MYHRFQSKPIILIFNLFMLVFMTVTASSQFKLSEWESYTSMFDSYTASVDTDGMIWVATVGGVYKLDPVTSEYEEFRNINALFSLDVSTLNCNQENGAVYVGTLDGILEKYTDDKLWTHIFDIKNGNFSNPRINDIKFLR